MLLYNELPTKIQNYAKNALTQAQVEFIASTLVRVDLGNSQSEK